jgi:hypothetical protein
MAKSTRVRLDSRSAVYDYPDADGVVIALNLCATVTA